MAAMTSMENGFLPPHVPTERMADFNIYSPPGGDRDAFAPWLALRRSSPYKLLWSPYNGGHWIVLDGERIPELLADSDRLSSHVFTAPRELAEATNLIPLQVDPPEHKSYRAILTKEMGAKYLLALEAPLQEIATTLIQGFLERGRCEFITEFSQIYPIHVYLMLIDLPREDAQMLRHLTSQLSRPDGSMTPTRFIETLDRYLTPYVEARMRKPGTDLLSRVLSKPVDGRAWTFEEAIRVSRNLLVGGLDTVAALMGFVALHLARSPADQEEIRNDLRIIPSVVDEFIRRYPIVVLGREARFDFELDGVMVREHDLLMFPTMLHNLDSKMFDDPETVSFDRRLVAHATMGNGIHRCIGAGLARSELIAFLKVWHELVPPFEIDPGEAVRQHAGTVASVAHLPLVWNMR